MLIFSTISDISRDTSRGVQNSLALVSYNLEFSEYLVCQPPGSLAYPPKWQWYLRMLPLSSFHSYANLQHAQSTHFLTISTHWLLQSAHFCPQSTRFLPQSARFHLQSARFHPQSARFILNQRVSSDPFTLIRTHYRRFKNKCAIIEVRQTPR